MPTLRIRRLPAMVPLLTALLVGVWLGSVRGELNARATASLSEEEEEQFEVFWQAWDLVRSDYVAPDGMMPETSALVDGAIRGMIEALDEDTAVTWMPRSFHCCRRNGPAPSRALAPSWSGTKGTRISKSPGCSLDRPLKPRVCRRAMSSAR